MNDALKQIWEKVDQMLGPQRMETEAEHIARDMREGRFPERSDPIQVPVAGPAALAALAAAYPADLAEAGKVLEGVTVIANGRYAGERSHFTIHDADTVQKAADTIRSLIALATAQAAQIAGLEAFIRNDADWEFSAKRRLELFREQRARADAAETALATERAKVESVIRIAASLFPGGYDNNHARICAAITEAGHDR